MKIFTRIIMILVISLTATIAKGVTANFTADVTAGCAPLVVHFTNTSTGATSYFWNLGNSTTSALTDVSGSYLTPGTYTVTLTAYSGATSSVKTMVITVYPLPTVSFTASDVSVCPNTPITFTSTSTGGVPGPMTYIWAFGDGGTSTLPNPTHSYSSPGFYNITLSVTNAQGCVKSLTMPAYIHVFSKPIPNFTVPTPYICNPPATFTFSSTSSGTGPLTYLWRFGDGGTGTGTSSSHTYTAAGFYTVTLIVTDANGCVDSLVRPAYVHVGNMIASFTWPASACVNTVVSFTNTSTPHTSSLWDFGDGWTSPLESPSHVYTTPGTYTVSLTVSDGPCSHTVTHTITILPAPVATFTITPAQPCPAPAAVTYAGTVPSGSTVSWTFGDGGSASGSSAAHTYGSNGVYTVVMTVTSAAGCTASAIQFDTIYDFHITANATPIKGCVPLTVTFNSNTYTTVPYMHAYPYGPVTYSWNFGDGSGLGAGPTTSHTYTAVGVYNATVTATSANGCTVSQVITIEVGSPPSATFTAAPTHICYGKTVTFTPVMTSGPIDGYIWVFGDGGTATTAGTYVYTYALPGVFTVTLTPIYRGCPGAPYVLTNYITVDSPKAIINKTFPCVPRTRVNFFNNSLGDDTHIWLFGDATTSTLDNPVHTYPALGTYTVTLATYNASSGCRDTAREIINLVDLSLNITADDTTICKYGTVNFTATVTGGSASSYQWYVAGLTKPWKVNPTLLDTFMTSGAFTIMLITTDIHDCRDTIIKPNYIKVGKPVVSFSGIPTIGCAPLLVNFTDASTDIAGVTLTSHEWDFGDGGTATVGGLTVAHTYTAAGVYPVTQIVTDNIGCKDTLVRPSYITVFKPAASFSAGPLYPCIGTTVSFSNTSGSIVSSYWWFGDGATSTTTSPTHVYTATGAYTIKLAVTDANGCHDTATLPAFINVTKPDASFLMSDSFSVCPPLTVNFTNTTTGATTYAWDFGDGNTSIVPSPSNLYITPAYYTVSLVATNVYGCKDTAIRHVNVYGYAGAFTYSPLSGCSPLTVSFNATVTNVASLTWDFADGITSTTTSDTTSHIYTIPGAYVPKLILSDNTGCQNSSVGTDTIKVNKVEAKFSTDPNPVCIGGAFSFVDSSTSYWSTVSSWSWSYDGQSSSLQEPVYTFTATGTFPVSLVATDGWGCIGSLTKNITVNPLPTIEAGKDTVVCIGDPATLLATGGVSYVWGAGPTLSCTACNPALATPTVPTVYTVIGTDVNGCQNTDTVQVFLRTHTIAHAWHDTAVCRGIPIALFDTGGTKYKWMPDFGLSSTTIFNPIATPASTVTYTVIAQIGSCIPDTDYVSLTIFQLPTVDAGPDQRLLAGSIAQLTSSGTLIASYAWSPSESLSCSDCANPVASMSVTTTYKVDVLSDHGCTATDSVRIVLYCDNSQIFIPNSFSPNGDGQNDVFYPRGKGVSNIKTFRVYNRWGELMYEQNNLDANDAAKGWDGSYKGGAPKPDVYVYLLEADCSTGEPISIKGDVTIIR